IREDFMHCTTISNSTKKQFAACYSTFFINGALALSIGALLPYIRDSYGLDYAFAGLLVSLHSVGNLISSFLAGVLPLWLGRRKSMLVFSFCFMLSFMMMTWGATPALLIAAYLMSGLARGAVSNFNNSVINEIAPGKAIALNILHAMFAIGAFLAPFIVLLCTSDNAENWRVMCYLMAGMGVVEFIIYALMPIPHDEVVKAEKASSNGAFLREKQFWICTGTLFFYLCAEQGVIGWMVTYFKDSGLMSAGYAQMMASILWILILVGRLTAGWLSLHISKSRLLVLMGLGFVLFFGVVMLGRSLPLITFGIAGFGFSMAGIYPTTVSLSGDTIKAYPLAWSTMLTLAGFGAILMPSVIGTVANTAGIYAGMLTITVAVALTLCFIFANFMLHRGENAD
ncbi:MAG: MFS transporter, partial [Ruthenibacterium sp.]